MLQNPLVQEDLQTQANTAQAEIAPPAANPSNTSLGCPRAGKDLTKTFPEGILQQGNSHCSTGTEESPRVPSGQDNALSCPDCSEAEHPGQETGEEKQSPWLSGAALKALPRFGNSGGGWRHMDASPGLVPGCGSAPGSMLLERLGHWEDENKKPDEAEGNRSLG